MGKRKSKPFIAKKANEPRAYLDRSDLTEVIIPDGVTEIGASAFCSCSSLTSVEIPASVTKIGASAFAGCSGLTTVEIPDSVTWIGDAAFKDCTGLTSVVIPDSVKKIRRETFPPGVCIRRKKNSRGRLKKCLDKIADFLRKTGKL